MKEIWKTIEGYEGYYEVSNFGRVRSLDRVVIDSLGRAQHRKGKMKAQNLNTDGYPTVNLSKDGIDKRISVHILVGKAFVDGYFDGAEINHIDCDRINNRVDNLEWVSHNDNVKYSIDMGNHVSVSANYFGENNPNYGNHKLKEKYAKDKELSKLKQGRKGKQNGKSIPVIMTSLCGKKLFFDYIGECAKYLIQNSIPRSKSIDAVRNGILKAIKQNTEYYGLRFEKVR
jgi:hypothetical protein